MTEDLFCVGRGVADLCPDSAVAGVVISPIPAAISVVATPPGETRNHPLPAPASHPNQETFHV